nr:serine hydrolase domain-containing protein [Parvularcula mediterranea]
MEPTETEAEAVAAEVRRLDGVAVGTEEIDAFFNGFIASGAVPGLSVAIINDNEIVYSRNLGLANVEAGEPIGDDTLFEAASLSKPLFGMLTVKLAEEGVLDLSKPLYEYYPHPDLTDDPRAQEITARMVLSHQTGLPNWRWSDPENVLRFQADPGEAFIYSGEGYEYLEEVLKHNLDTDDLGLDEVFVDRIAGPAGLRDTTFVQSDGETDRKATGYDDGAALEPDLDYGGEDSGFGAAHSVHSTADDYAKAMIAFMEGDILSDEATATFLEGQNSPIPEDEPSRALGLVDWALGFSVYETPFGYLYTHGGNNSGYTSFVMVSPENGWGYTFFTNEDQANDEMIAAAMYLTGAADQ